MDFGAPVAAGVQPFSQGLQTLSSLLGLKQQQLGIARQQIGLSQAQQQLSQETSQATQAAIHTKNLQNLQGVDWKQYQTPEGYDIQAAQQKALEVGGADAAPFVSRLADMTTAGTGAKKALFSLSQDYQKPLRNAYALWSADKHSKLSDLGAQLEAVIGTYPKSAQEQARQVAKSTLGLIAGPDLFTGQPKTLDQQKKEALSFARAGLGESEVSGTSGLATPAVSVVSTGGAIVPQAQSRTTGAIEHPSGAIATTLPPTVIHQPLTNAPAVVGGGQGTTPKPIGAAGSAAGPAPWWQATWQPSPGQSQMVAGQVEALQHRINAGEVAANSAPQAIDALDRSRAILDKGAWTGTQFSLFKDLKNSVAGLGLDTSSAQNASELAKNLARYEAARAGSVGSTDAARSLYEAGAPNTKMDAAAVKAVILQSLGIEKMIQGYAKVVGGAPDPHAALQAEQRLRSIPHLVQAYELGFMRNKAEADEFFKRYGVSGRDLAKSAAELRALGAM